MQDSELLREYVATGSETAFAQLVERYVGLVHGTARRLVYDQDQAQDIAQAVFCLLAQKAATFTGDIILAGWLHRATCYTAARAIRSEQRRRLREQEVVELNTINENGNKLWDEVAPHIDAAVRKLSEKDQLAILLRYFQQKTMREVGEAMGVSEAAAKVRVGRALEQIRKTLSREGIACSTALLGITIAQGGAHAVPSAIVGKITAGALSGAAATGGTSVMGFMAFLLRTPLRTVFAGGALALTVAFVATVLGNNYRVERQTQKPSTNKRARPQFPRPTVPGLAASEYAEFNELIARLQAALANTNFTIEAHYEVRNAVSAFDPRFDVAFPVLKQVAETYDPVKAQEPGVHDQNMIAERAVGAMGGLGKSVPDAVPYLWSKVESSLLGSGHLGSMALSALSGIGFEPFDIPLLVEKVFKSTNENRLPSYEVQMMTESGEMVSTNYSDSDSTTKSQAATWISAVLEKSGPAATAYVYSLRGALDNPYPTVRFWAACAALKQEESLSRKAVAVIASCLRQIPDDDLGSAAHDHFKTAGNRLRPIVGDLLKAAESASPGTRKSLLLAVGFIDSTTRDLHSEVNQLLTKEEEDEAWLAKLNARTATLEEIIPRLTNSASAGVAAHQLQEMGQGARSAVPHLIEALLSDRGNETEIFKALAAIDPDTAKDYTPVSVEVFQSGVEAAMRAARNEENPQKVLDVLFGKKGGNANFYHFTRKGLPEVMQKLKEVSPEAAQAFAGAAVLADPSLSVILPFTNP